MTVSFISTNTLGAGNQFTFGAAGDALIVLNNVTLGSTSGTAFSSAFSDVEVTVLGTMVSTAQIVLSTGSSFVLGDAGSFFGFGATPSLAGLFLNGAGSSARIEGTFSAPESLGLLTTGGGQIITVTGSITAATAVYLFSSGPTGDVLVNSGQITSTAQGDAGNGTFFNNAVFVEGNNVRITNLVGGVITATGAEANGVRAFSTANGLIVTNHGTITSVNSTAVDFSALALGGGARLINTGVIQGATQSFSANDSAALFTIVNSGQMIGNVFMGIGDDSFDGRGGRIDGLWFGDDGSDLYNGRGASLISGAISGGGGNDTLLGGDGAEQINGDTDNDVLRGGGGDDTLSGGLNSDVLAGDDGDDQMFGGADFDTISGGSGNDTVDGEAGALMAFGGAGDDEIFANAGDDLIYGGTGDDAIDGFDGQDSLYGGVGDDSLHQAAGNGLLYGGRGDDTVSGGDGDDLMDGGADADNLDGGNGLDTLVGGSGDDQILGGNDNDSLEGGIGDDVVLAGLGHDRAYGGTGNDLLSGQSGNDSVNGQVGDDTLIGGTGGDSLTGGTGADVFIMAATTDSGVTVGQRDGILDFEAGIDRFNLSQIDANSTLAGNQAFSYILGASFNNVAGELRYSATTGLLQGDVNGDAVVDFVVEFRNLPALALADLIL